MDSRRERPKREEPNCASELSQKSGTLYNHVFNDITFGILNQNIQHLSCISKNTTYNLALPQNIAFITKPHK